MTADGPGADGVVVTAERGSRRRIADSYSAEVAGYSAANVRNNGAVVFGSPPIRGTVSAEIGYWSGHIPNVTLPTYSRSSVAP